MSMNTVPERLAALRAAMKVNGVDVYLIPVGDPHSSEYLPDHYTSLTYFSGFHGENSNFVVTPTESAVWADGRYFVQAEKEIAGTEIQLMRMGEPGVPTVEEYCGKVLPENGVLGLCGLTASCGLVRGVQKELDAKKGTIKTLNLEDELWTEGRPARPATPAWILPKEYAGFSPAEKLERLRGKLKELGCPAQLVGKLDNLAWLLNLRARDLPCTPLAVAYALVTMDACTLFIAPGRLSDADTATLAENGVTLRGYEEIIDAVHALPADEVFLVDEKATNYALYEALTAHKTVAGADPIFALKGIKNDTELKNIRECHIRDGVAVVRFQMDLEKALAEGKQLTEIDIDTMLQKRRAEMPGYFEDSFSTIAAYGTNAAMMHYHAEGDVNSVIEPRGFSTAASSSGISSPS